MIVLRGAIRWAVVVAVVQTVTAWSSWSWTPSQTSSSFTGTALPKMPLPTTANAVRGMFMYDSRGDPPDKGNRRNSRDNNNSNQNDGGGGPPINAWSVLATTEEWISSTLQASTQSNGQNPYTRKEVSYVCETSHEQAMIVAGIFRRLKEARQLGQRHGEQERERAIEMGYSYRPSTLRQTQVVVIPSNPTLTESFADFDKLIETINAARRHARDYVTGAHLERMDGDDDDDYDDDYESPWSVSVNCAHLHPQFGHKTPEQELEEMKSEEAAGEVDLHYKEFQEKRLAARRSPYPTIVVEVRANPPPDFGSSPPRIARATSTGGETDAEQVTADDIQKLEALFGQSAHMNHPTKHLTDQEEEDDFYARIGNTIEELTALTPMQMAQEYIAQNDPTVPSDASFTTSDAQEVDEAYEFVFTNFAMMAEGAEGNTNPAPRYYVVLPHFCAASATSLEKFCGQVGEITDALSDLRGKIDISSYHPEHIMPTRRAPVPVLAFQWKD